MPWQELRPALVAADIVVTATGAAEPVLTRATVDEAMRSRRNRPLFVIDIALPRDVESAVGDLEQVFLYHMDDLQSIVSENLARRSTELASAEAIVDEEVARFASWLQSREIVPTIVALRQRFESIRQAELQRLEPKLGGLTPEARAKVDEVTRLLVEKLLLTPTEQLKTVGDDSLVVAYAEALHRLFTLTPPDESRREARGSRRATRPRSAAPLSPPRVIRIATRGSRLALWQAHAVANRLRAAGARTEVIVMTTTGDRSQQSSVPGDDSKRQFVKELEDALLRGDADVAVHSAKDLPVELPEGLTVAACLPREDARDGIVLPDVRRPGRPARRTRPARAGRDHRHRQRAAGGATGAAPRRSHVRPHSRQRGHAPGQARCRGIQRARARLRRPPPAGVRQSHLDRDSSR